MNIVIKSTLNNIKKKDIIFADCHFVVFSSCEEILDCVIVIIKKLIYNEQKIDPLKISSYVDIPGWLIIDMKNNLIYQDHLATLPCFFDRKKLIIYLGYPSTYDSSEYEIEYDLFGYCLAQTFQNLIMISAGTIYNYLTREVHEWFVFKRSFLNSFDLSHFDQILNHTFDKLSSLLGKNKIVIPLSGGFDSRIILEQMIIRKFNVQTYSIGSYHSPEVKTAKSIATSLNIPFFHINVDRNSLAMFLKTKEFKDFWIYSGGNFSLPHFAECMFSLKEPFLDTQAYVLPGHSLDFLAGSHLPLLNDDSKFCLNSSISEYHCIPRRSLRLAADIASKYTNKDLNGLSALENFDYNYRQSRYIVNHIRNFEYIGLTPLLPLFGFSLVNYFMNLKYADLYKRKSLLKYYKYSIKPLQNLPYVTSYPDASRIKKFLKKSIFLRSLVSLYRYFTYKEKDTIFLSVGFLAVLNQIFIRGCIHPLAILRLLRKVKLE